jgi:hypothetical protein
MQITANFTREELLVSRPFTYNDTLLAKKGTKIVNTPTDFNGVSSQMIENNLQNLCIRVLQPLRDAACLRYKTTVYIKISSCYRCPIYNADVGGEKASEHLYGLAADIMMYYTKDGNRVYLSNAEIVSLCKDYKIPYERIIDEQLWRSSGNGKDMFLDTWIHISTNMGAGKPQLIHREARNTKTNLATVYTTVKQGTW